MSSLPVKVLLAVFIDSRRFEISVTASSILPAAAMSWTLVTDSSKIVFTSLADRPSLKSEVTDTRAVFDVEAPKESNAVTPTFTAVFGSTVCLVYEPTTLPRFTFWP